MKYFTLILIIWSPVLLAQSGNLKGKVSDEKGEAVAFVNIQLLKTNLGQSTGEDGTFEFENVKNGEYVLFASFVGYKPLEQFIKIEDGKTLNLVMELQENAELLKEIVVKGTLSINEKINSIGKANIRVMDLPQAAYTIDRGTLESQQANNMQDVLMNTNGVYIMGATGGYQEEIAGRGFSFGSNNTFKNGTRYNNSMIPEISSLEKVEVLKGSAAVLYGNVGPGGVLNLVTKKPKFNFGGEVGLRIGSFGMLKPSFDMYGGIGKNEKAAFRINGTYQKANSFRQFVNSERFYINPSLLFKISKKSELLLEADYLDDDRLPDFGAGIVNYEVLTDYPRDRFLGVKWGNVHGKQFSGTATHTYRFSEKWKLTTTGTYRDSEQKLFSNRRPNTGGLIGADGLWTRSLQKSENYDNYFILQSDLTGEFKTGSIAHQFLIGTDTDHFTTITQSYAVYTNYDQINIFEDLPENSRNDIPEMTNANFSYNPTNRYGIYVQDLISLLPKLKVLGGLRYSYQRSISNVTSASGELTVTETPALGAFSPKAGLVFQPNMKHSVFVSYSNNFSPNTGVDINGNALSPSIIGQYEAGIKNELLNGKASVNFTLYQIDDSNRSQISLENGNTNNNIKELAGHVQSRGAELDITARPLNAISILAGYSYNKTVVVESNTLTIGSPIRYMPNHTANGSIYYNSSKGFNLGFTSAYIGQRYAGRDTPQRNNTDGRKPVPLPAYFQFDANAGYSFKNIQLRAKVGNLFNQLSYNVHDDNSVNPIAPRNYSLSLAYKF